MSTKPLIILASARKESDTRDFLNEVFDQEMPKLIDLLDYSIAPYNYEHQYPDSDEFDKITDELLQHEVIVFATPVYWYAMSGLMKQFFDRFTDLVTIKKDVGRKLKGRKMYLVAVGADEEIPEGFEVPFQLTADYLGMDYKVCLYHSTKNSQSKEELSKKIKAFINMIEQG